MAPSETNKALRLRDLGVIAVLAAVGAALIVVLDKSGGSDGGSSDPGKRGEISSPARLEPVPSPPIEPDSQTLARNQDLAPAPQTESSLQTLARDSQAPPPSDATAAAPTEEPTSTGSIDANRTPMDCVPDELKRVLHDVSARFGSLTIVSTTHVHTDNHVIGSDREKLHAACKAVDFRIEGAAPDDVLRYLRGRREIAGVNSYRRGLIHIDANERYVAPAGR